MRSLFDGHIELQEKVLDLRLQRQNLVMSNVANVNTPQYKAKRLEFEQDLQTALALDMKGKVTRTNDAHMPATFDESSFKGTGGKEFKPRYVHGEDSVDLDKEMTVMAKNAMLYNALTEVISKNFTGMQKIISEGGK
ncbi:flagellar basal body rod protein FlgB [Desulfovibrio aminophilus]|nr:flagellar basal body rod protein FlgB [Desulfovibrio aminophilus]MCM0753777.1 flagellar basal body rod protein FlgB [Desulfovibrio aminophilus]